MLSPRQMEPEVESVIRRATYASVVVGVILSPIPLADELVLLPAYGALAARIGRAHGIPLGSMPWRPIVLTALAGLGARAAINLTVSYIPFVAAAANAASAVMLTRIFGRYVDDACHAPKSAQPLRWKDLVDSMRSQKNPTRA
jgi:uncharacterized protein (DUF697 family)